MLGDHGEEKVNDEGGLTRGQWPVCSTEYILGSTAGVVFVTSCSVEDISPRISARVGAPGFDFKQAGS